MTLFTRAKCDGHHYARRGPSPKPRLNVGRAAEQGKLVAILNFALTGLWALDILVAWASRRTSGFVEGLHALTHLGVLVAIFTAAVLSREGVVMWLGLAATVLPLAALLVRFGAVPSAAR